MKKVRFSGFAPGATVAVSATQKGKTVSASTPAWGQASAAIQVDRSNTQVAPEGVIFRVTDFDGFAATGPSGGEVFDDRFHDLRYKWTFDDPGTFSAPANLPVAHKNSNVAYGPQVAHVFKSPGTYTVTCEIYEQSSGKTATITEDVTVGDPDTLYAGALTIFVDPDASYGDAPAGAVTTTTLAGAYAVTENKTAPYRIMLARGKTHSATRFRPVANYPSLTICAGPGVGAQPIIASTEAQNNEGILWADGHDPDRVKDLKVFEVDATSHWDSTTETGFNVGAASFINMGASETSYMMCHGCNLSGFLTAIASNGQQTGGTKVISDLFITNWRDYGIYENTGTLFALAGCRITRDPDARSGGPEYSSYNTKGPIRIAQARHASIDACDFFSRTGWFENIPTYRTQQACIRWNQSQIIGARLNMQRCSFEGGWQVLALTAMNTADPTNPQNLVIEKNIFVASHMTKQVIELQFGGVSIRNNILIVPDVQRIAEYVYNTDTFFTLGNNGGGATAEALASPIVIAGNTLVNLMTAANAAGSHTGAVLESFGSGVFGDVTIANNLIHQPNLDTPVTTYAPLDDTVLWQAREKGYISDEHPVLLTQYASPADFIALYTPLAGSAAIGAALTGEMPADDFWGELRPVYPSTGALEVAD